MPALLFDFDGVLVDSEPMHEAALLAALNEVGMTFTHEQYLAKLMGFGDFDCFNAVAAMQGRTLTSDDHADLARRKWTHAQRAIAAGAVKPYDATINLLREASQSLPTAICSGALRHEICAILEQLGVAHLPRVITTADDTPRSKPHPAPYRLTCDRLGIPPRECVTIEDTPKGIASAKAAGVRVVGVCHSLPAERLSEADLIVNSTADLTLSQLLQLL
ncbi:MAG TPA: HAD family phosphatase [Phycisphaerales bacterium]|nr:HAD family phosphatase [Phycisphaerales bacterium]